MITRIRVVLAAATLLAGLPVCAASAGHEQIAALPALADARLLDSSAQPDVEKVYPLGAVNRISGQLRFGDEVRVRGERQANSWQLSQLHSAAEAFTEVRERLQQEGARLLYWCEGRDCGPSNLWANAIFANARLYGPDERQQYALLVSGRQLAALYAVTRGNGRGMLHVDLLQAGEPLPESLSPAAATLLLQLRTDGGLELEHAQAEQLARALNRDMTLRVLLAGPDADDWRERLVAAGVRAARIELSDVPAGVTRIDVLR